MASASIPPIKHLFTKNFDFQPSMAMAREISRWRILYENRDQHAEALNTPLLAVHRIKFMPKDSDALFDIVGASRSEFVEVIRQSSINNDFIVSSDAYNLLTMWVVHKFYNSNLPQQIRMKACEDVLFMLLVKFFSSLVGHWFPYAPKKEIMEATIDSLSDKFDIKKKETCTWKLVLEARAKELLDPKNIHIGTIKTFIPDLKVTYVLTDTQTRMRTKLRLIVQAFHEMKAKGGVIADSTLLEDDKESGETRVKDVENNFDTMITSVSNRVLNVNQFVRSDYIKIVCSKTAQTDIGMLRNVLVRFSTIASYQYKKHKQEDIAKNGDYIGYLVLIRNLIQVVYRQCVLDKVNLRSKLAILDKATNLFKSSRISDPGVVRVKSSIDKMVVETGVSRRPATIASLKIAVALYLVLLTFDLD